MGGQWLEHGVYRRLREGARLGGAGRRVGEEWLGWREMEGKRREIQGWRLREHANSSLMGWKESGSLAHCPEVLGIQLTPPPHNFCIPRKGLPGSQNPACRDGEEGSEAQWLGRSVQPLEEVKARGRRGRGCWSRGNPGRLPSPSLAEPRLCPQGGGQLGPCSTAGNRSTET